MSFLKLSTIFCTFLILQTQALPQNHATTNVNDIIDVIKGFVANIEGGVDKILSDISAKLDGFIENPDSHLAGRITGLLDRILDRSVDLANIHLNILKEDGNDDTKVVVGCIQNEEDAFKFLVNSTFDNNANCFVAALVTFHQSLKPILGDLQEVQSDVKKSLAKLDTCSGNDVDAILCAVDAAKDALEVLKEIPEKTSQDVKNVIEVVKGLPQSVKSCIKSNAGDFRAKFVELIDTVSTCSRK